MMIDAEIFVSLALANILLPFCLHEPTHTARFVSQGCPTHNSGLHDKNGYRSPGTKKNVCRMYQVRT